MSALMTPVESGAYTPHCKSQQVAHDQSMMSAADAAHPQTSRNEAPNTSGTGNSTALTNSQLSAYIAKQKILDSNV